MNSIKSILLILVGMFILNSESTAQDAALRIAVPEIGNYQNWIPLWFAGELQADVYATMVLQPAQLPVTIRVSPEEAIRNARFITALSTNSTKYGSILVNTSHPLIFPKLAETKSQKVSDQDKKNGKESTR